MAVSFRNQLMFFVCLSYILLNEEGFFSDCVTHRFELLHYFSHVKIVVKGLVSIKMCNCNGKESSKILQTFRNNNVNS